VFGFGSFNYRFSPGRSGNLSHYVSSAGMIALIGLIRRGSLKPDSVALRLCVLIEINETSAWGADKRAKLNNQTGMESAADLEFNLIFSSFPPRIRHS
jgi:hypothetical protein